MPVPSIIRGSDYMFSTTYEGNGGGQRIGKFVPFTDNGTIAKSCIFDSASNVSLTRTPSGAGNRKTFTVSFWVKRARLGDAAGNNTYGQRIFNVGTSSNWFDIKWSGSGDTEGADRLHLREYASSAEQLEYWTNRRFEDTSKWYHIVVQVNTTESTSSNRIKVYVDGDEITDWYRSNAPSQDYDTQVNATVLHNIGRYTGATSNNLDSYLAEFNFVDGSIVDPSTFGLTDTSTGRWIPKSLTGISYGTNGFRMEFANSAGQTIGDDTSGQGNDYAVSNIATTDIVTDSPTQNHPIFEPNFSSSSVIFSNGNLTVKDNANNNYENFVVGMPVKTGKWYFEITVDNYPNFYFIGVNNASSLTANKNQYPGYADGSASFLFHTSADYVYYGNNGNNYYTPGSSTTLANGNKLGVAYDADTGAMWIAKNNSYLYSGNPSTGANPLFIGYTPGELVYFSVSSWAQNVQTSFNFGQKSFSYTPPTGFNSIQQDNLSTTNRGIPGLVWAKSRDNTGATLPGQLVDSSRGVGKRLISSGTNTEAFDANHLTKFLKGGYATGDINVLNTAGDSMVAWNWVGNGGTTATNNDGETTSTVQVNSTSNFSIGTFTSKSAEQTIGHGLGVVPEFIIMKCRSNSQNWFVYHKELDLSDSHYLHLNANDAEQTGSDFGNFVPTSSVFQANPTGTADRTYVFYAWAPVEGFSKFGSYRGNGNANGPFVYTGFKPSWLMIKRSDSSTGGNWSIIDNTRHKINPVDKPLLADTGDPESGLSSITMDLLSNGFKIRNTLNSNNNSSGTYVYFAFAEHPFIGDGTNPATAR